MRILTVITPATRTGLLTTEQLREAFGDDSGLSPARQEMINESLSAQAAAYCRVEGDGRNPPTILRERVQDDIVLDREERFLDLSRILVVPGTITVTIAGIPVGGNVRHIGAGMLAMFSGSWEPRYWPASKLISVQYDSGLDKLPGSLVLALSEQAAANAVTVTTGTPNEGGIKREEIPGVRIVEYFDTGTEDTTSTSGGENSVQLSGDVQVLLAPYVKPVIA